MAFVAIILFAPLFHSSGFAQSGDTIVVQTFTYGSPQNDTFQFPADSIEFRKIIMLYNLKCVTDPGGAGGLGYPCGEWDYLTYTYLYNHTGNLDSTLYYQPGFTADGLSPDSFRYSKNVIWDYDPHYEYFMVYTDTQSLDTAALGIGSINLPVAQSTSSQEARTQVLWSASELSAAGLTTGNITGLRVNLASFDSGKGKLTIRLKHTTQDSLDANAGELTGFSTVFEQTIGFTSAGWHSLAFTKPFNWNGTSNILLEFCHDNATNQVAYDIKADTTAFTSLLYTAGRDHFLDFDGPDRIEVPAAAFSGIDSFLTISFWQYGDPAIQPQSDFLFEGLDSDGNRVLNVHLPWGNGQVYWDAGNDGSSYDRINKTASTSDYEGKWNFWTFVKDLSIGQMYIYLNGSLFHYGTGKTNPVDDIATFRIGSSGKNSGHYDGMIDEFRVWDKALTLPDIQEWMYRDIDTTHPYYSDLAFYYNFNKGQGLHVKDNSNNNNAGALQGIPQWQRLQACDMFRNFVPLKARPQIIFEKGVFTSHIDSTLLIDSVPSAVSQVVLYNNPSNPTIATDTMYVWASGYNYIFNAQGSAIDSVWRHDSTLQLIQLPYYGTPFEIIDRYELGRYITPYGIGLSLGNDGWTWAYDVTDFRPLLSGNVHLSAGNWQEWLDMKFVMIKGTPPRNVIGIENLWNGSHQYNSSIETNFLIPKKVAIDANAGMARLRVTNTGHGFGGNENCAEFCAKTHTVHANGSYAYSQYLWRDNCGMNPLYPQGGTWIYDRSNWCPGAEVTTHTYDMTPYITAGDTLIVDYNVQPGYLWNGQGSSPTWVISSQLVTYSAPNFTTDAAMDEVLAPNDWEMLSRFNPVCNNPKVRIQNTGSDPLTSLTITYGPKGGNKETYQWAGNLGFLEKEDVELPPSSWGSWAGQDVFEASLSLPNGTIDQYPDNNLAWATFKRTPVYHEDLILWFRTNHAGSQTTYKLTDIAGNVLYSRTNSGANTLYKDTFHLAQGCYTLTIKDAGDDGLKFWANMPPYGNGTAGYAKLWKMGGGIVKDFQPDFGSEISQSFTVGYAVGMVEEKYEDLMEVYPNPTPGHLTIAYAFEMAAKAEISIYNLSGQKVASRNTIGEATGEETFDLCSLPQGVYVVILKTAQGLVTKKAILTK